MSDLWSGGWHTSGPFTVVDSTTGFEKYTCPGMDGWGRDSGHDAFLPTQIVETSYSESRAVRAWSRDDGRLVQTQPITRGTRDCQGTPLRIVPGAILVICVGRQTAELASYTP